MDTERGAGGVFGICTLMNDIWDTSNWENVCTTFVCRLFTKHRLKMWPLTQPKDMIKYIWSPKRIDLCIEVTVAQRPMSRLGIIHSPAHHKYK